MTDLLVVESGLFGLTIAREVAKIGAKVTLIDRRDHLGGDAWSEPDPETGIEVHKYGAHLFYTFNERVWEYVNRFTTFTPYVHHVYTTVKGVVYPMPVNLGIINQFFNAACIPDEARALIASQTADIDPAHIEDSFRTKEISLVGKPPFEAFFEGYTAKQWQTDPTELSAVIVSRLPICYNYDNCYFNDVHKGLPTDGYGTWLTCLADHLNIEVKLNTDFSNPDSAYCQPQTVGQVPVVYTGPIDQYFQYREGELGWRTIDLELEVKPTGDFQGCAAMNYGDCEVPFARIHKFRHFHPECADYYPQDRTVIAREYSRSVAPGDEPYHPINATADRKRLETYWVAAATEPNVLFGGRLGTCKYLDMHMAIASALSRFDNMVALFLAGKRENMNFLAQD